MGILYCCINFGYRKSLDKRGEYHDFLSKIFCLTVPKTSVWELYCCINFGYRKSLDKMGEYHNFLSKIFCLTVPKIFVGESFSVALISGTEKVWRRGGGGYEVFTSKSFCLTVPINFVGESFTVALISGIEKVWIRGGSITIFCRKFFVSQCRKLPYGNPLLLH